MIHAILVVKTQIARVRNLWLGGIYTYNIAIVDEKLPPEEGTVAWYLDYVNINEHVWKTKNISPIKLWSWARFILWCGLPIIEWVTIEKKTESYTQRV